MQNILLIGAGDFQLPLVQRASLSYNVLLAAPVVSDAFKPYIKDSLLIDVRDKEAILAYAKEHAVCGVTTDQTDIAVRSVAYVAEQLGLPGIGYETGCLFTDKSLMRDRMQELGIKLLPHRTVSSEEEAQAFYAEIGGDVIIKPLDTQGSRGVQVCRSAAELRSKYAEADRWSSNHCVLIERYATGREFVVEGIAVDYRFQNACIGDTLYFDLPDAFAAKSRIFPTTADEKLRQRVLDLNTKIITGFGLKQGITHSEFIMDGDEIYLIETAARGGGVFISSDLIHYSCGLDTEGFLLDLATGRQKDLPRILPQQCVCGYLAFYVPVGKILRVSGVKEVQALPFVHRNQLDKLREAKEAVEGTVTSINKGGVMVNVKGIQVFVPASLTGVPKGEDLNTLLKTKVKLHITEINQSRRRVIGSMKAVAAEERRAKVEAIWNEIEIGKVYTGVVRSMTSYGAFVDIGGVDGMIHVSEVSWMRIRQPSDVLSIGDQIEVYVIDFDKEKKKISLGYKKAEDNPWEKFLSEYQVGDIADAKIVSITSFGAFAQIVEGVDGLIHISQLADRRVENVKDVVSVGDEVRVKITNIDEDSKRISLSIREAMDDEDFED